jgi:hypothetical protein
VIVSFKDFELEPRYDGTQWTKVNIFEAALVDANDVTTEWNLIDSQQIDMPITDPSDPQPVSFTTNQATLDAGVGWYKIQSADDGDNIRDYEPIFNPATTEIMATLDDVNAHLDGEVIEATADNSNLVQVSVARIVRGYLAAAVDTTTLMSWQTPEETPSTVREIASMLIAAQVYFNLAARQSYDISNFNYAQRLYDAAMAMLQGIVDGTIGLGDSDGIIIGADTAITTDDFFPIDATDRAFTMGMIL